MASISSMEEAGSISVTKCSVGGLIGENERKIMPCRDDRDDCRQDYSDLQAKLDKVTKLLCGLCRGVEKAGGATKLIQPNKELNAWWNEHQEADRRREAQEKAERELKAKRQAALNKLSPEERKLLNIR